MTSTHRRKLRDRLIQRAARSRAARTLLLLGAFVVTAVLVALFAPHPNLAHVNVAFLSGSVEGHYHAIVANVAREMRREHGRIDNRPSAGSVENIERLVGATKSCDLQFGLVQDGLAWPATHRLQLIGRLPESESFVLLGRHADAVRSLADLRGLRVGIGPVGSGTEYVARQLVAQLTGLEITLTNQSLQEQLELLERGALDLGAMVISEDSALLTQAVRDRKLQMVDIAAAAALAHHLPSARAGTIKAGFFDPVHDLPPTDKRVIQIDTLVVGNGCARDSVTQGVMTAFVRVFPGFVAVNRERPNVTGLDYAPAARSYLDRQGPDPVGVHVPWLIDIMPTARWVELAFVFSLVFGAQAAWHRWRLWRLDAARVRIEGDLASLFEPGMTVDEIATATPTAAQRSPAALARLDQAIDELRQLDRRCRRQSLSMLVPMGQESKYRYQEALVEDLLAALRRYRARWNAAEVPADRA